CPADSSPCLVAVLAGHHDIGQYDVRLFLDDLRFQLVAVEVRHDVVPGRPENRLHHLELGVSVVDHHHLGHRARASRGVLPLCPPYVPRCDPFATVSVSGARLYARTNAGTKAIYLAPGLVLVTTSPFR